jgi:hypothetical protein
LQISYALSEYHTQSGGEGFRLRNFVLQAEMPQAEPAAVKLKTPSF